MSFDIGVLMGTQSQAIFDEYVAMHQGAQRLRAFWNKGCDCGREDCFRTKVQIVAGSVNDDPELMLAFLDRLKGFEPLTAEEFGPIFDRLYEEAAAKHGKAEDDKIGQQPWAEAGGPTLHDVMSAMVEDIFASS